MYIYTKEKTRKKSQITREKASLDTFPLVFRSLQVAMATD